MAIFTPGPIVGTISGPIDSIVFVQGKTGPFIRKRPVLIRKTTQATTAAQANWAFRTQFWRTLPEDWRMAYATAAKQISLPNKLGVRRQLSGFQFYMLAIGGNDTLGYAPSAAQPVYARPVRNLAFACDFSATTYDVTNTQVEGAGAGLLVWGARSFRTHDAKRARVWKYLGRTINPGSPLNVFSAFTAALGIAQVDEFVYIKTQIIVSSKLPSQLITASAQVVA
jgi:hypothetical protein